MERTWDLTPLYQGYDDPAFQKDLQTVLTQTEEFSTFIENLPTLTLEEIFATIETMSEQFEKIYYYVQLSYTTNTLDPTSSKYLNQLQMTYANRAKNFTVLDHYIASHTQLETLDKEHPTLSKYRFYIEQKQKFSKHLLQDDVEEVIAKLNVSGGNGYSTMHDYLTSTLKVPFQEDIVTLPAIRNLAYAPEQHVRKAAYEAELRALETIKAPISFALNNIKAQVLTLSSLRGYPSVLEMTLEQATMSKSTLDAMMKAIQSTLPKFHEYLKVKATLLGHTNGLPWYDLFAMIGTYDKTFTVEEAKALLLENFESFSSDLANMTQRAFDERWIDFDPRPGKVGGAYCMNLGFIQQSRVLTNYDGSLSDVVTLAHELGHAYHGMHIEHHAPLNRDYSMPVAETASTFNENIIMNAIIKHANKQDKLSLIESQLQDLTQIICDIYSRFLFESRVFAQREDHFMFDDELSQMMVEAQKEAYGDGLDHATLHPYMWVVKGHYYSPGLSFYNFPYAFGGLFARGLYAQYQKEGAPFVEKYQALLHATTINTVEDVAAICGLDLRDETFWNDALASVADLIDQFIELTK